MFYLPNEKIIFTSDVYSPGLGGFGSGPREFYTAITQTYSLEVTKVTGGHGATGTLDELRTAAGQ
jgi:hypothetical protein